MVLATSLHIGNTHPEHVSFDFAVHPPDRHDLNSAEARGLPPPRHEAQQEDSMHAAHVADRLASTQTSAALAPDVVAATWPRIPVGSKQAAKEGLPCVEDACTGNTD